jgi:hypothetical protein
MREEILLLEKDETDVLAASKVKVKAVPVQEMKAYTESGGTSLLKTSIGTRYRSAVNFTLRPFYLRERTPAPALLKYLANAGRCGNEEYQNRNGTSQGLKTNCSGDRALHACGFVTDAPPSLALLREIREMGNRLMNDRTELVFGDKDRSIQWRVKTRNSLRQAKDFIGKTLNFFLLENTNSTLANMTREFFSTDRQRFSHRDGPVKFRCNISNNFLG